MKNEYKPVSCSLYDQLTEASVFKKHIALVLHNSDIVNGKVTDIITRNKEEFLVLNHSLEIRLDNIISISSL